MAGALCISIDVELAWGIWDRPSREYHDRCARHEASVVRALIAMFEAYEVRATWAIVGRLLERDPRAAGSTPYGDRIWYAPELIQRIRNARVAQDIGSHSYAHVYFGQTPREALQRDLAAARRVHDEHGLPFTSFVFPRNQVAHLDLLREAGVRVFRSTDRGWHMTVRDRLGARAGRAANLADKLLPIPPAAVAPIEHPVELADGSVAAAPAVAASVDTAALIELPSSMLLMARSGLRRAVHPAAVVAKARLGLRAAQRSGDLFHLWFHPSNFYFEPERQLETLEHIVAAAAQMRDRGELEIRPMSSFAEA